MLDQQTSNMDDEQIIPDEAHDAESIANGEDEPAVRPVSDETLDESGEDASPTAGPETDQDDPEEASASEDGVDDSQAEAETEETNEDDAPQLPLTSIVEAVLFAARDPLKPQQIAKAVGKGTRQDAVRAAVDDLNLHYLETSRAFEIAEISGRFQLMSRPEFVNHIMRLYPKRELGDKDKTSRLTPAALDTLSIIAYKQPVTRGEIEHIRGVGCGPVLRALIERGTVKVAGKRTDLVGQPLMYGTTDNFLVEFGLGSLDELPLRNEFLAAFTEMGFESPELSAEIHTEPSLDGDSEEDGGDHDESPRSGDEEAEYLVLEDTLMEGEPDSAAP